MSSPAGHLPVFDRLADQLRVAYTPLVSLNLDPPITRLTRCSAGP